MRAVSLTLELPLAVQRLGSLAKRYLPLATVVWQVLYLLASVFYPNGMFGFNQLHIVGPIPTLLLLLSTWVVSAAMVIPKVRLPWRLPRPGSNPWFRNAAYGGIALSMFILFVTFRNRLVNIDSLWFLQAIPADVATRGAFLLLDELLESYVHSRFWYYTNLALGLDVRQSFHLLSAVGGGLFVLVILNLSGRLSLKRRSLFFALLAAGGYMQLFFGDVEHYTLATVAITLYLAAAWIHLEGRVGLLVPGALLGLAMGFHLLAAWLVPSYAFLLLQSWKGGDRSTSGLGLVVVPAVLGVLLLFFHFNGLPIQEGLANSHLGGLFLHSENYVLPVTGGYWLGMANLWFLLLPQVVLVPFLYLTGSVPPTAPNRFLLIASLCVVPYTLLWKAQLGVYQDWNLYAPMFIAPALFISYNLSQLPDPPGQRIALVAFTLTILLHTYAWILGNHYFEDYS